MKVTVNDMRKAGYCVAGTRAWAIKQGFTPDDWRAFVRNGIDVERLKDMDNALVKKIMEIANARR